jgi:hypothetical protein
MEYFNEIMYIHKIILQIQSIKYLLIISALRMSNIKSVLKSIWSILWRIGLFFVTWGVLLALFFVPFNSILIKWRQSTPIKARLYGDSISLLTILFATWILLRFLDRRHLATIGLSLNHIFRDIAIGLGVGIIWLASSIGIVFIFGWVTPVAPVGFSWMVLITTLVSMLFNVITQEFLLCGFILQTIRRLSGTAYAVIISALLFAGYHAGAFKGELLPVINVFAAGILFCLAYIKTGNLWFPIAIHFAWDSLLGPVLGLTESGITDLGGGWKMFTVNGPSLFTGGAFGLEGGLIVTVILLIIIISLFMYKPRQIREREKLITN